MSRVEDLLIRLEAVLEQRGRGSKKALAEFCGVRADRVSEWLRRDPEPSAENALAILEWLQGPSSKR